MVFAPSPLLTVTIEAPGDGAAEVHLHGGGQGVWIARMLARLGCEVVLCGPFGGEPGEVLLGLVEREGVTVRPVATAAANGVYVHDRRHGERRTVAEAAPPALQRHELDELYNLTLVEALESAVSVLGGPDDENVLPPDTYLRLARDLGGNGMRVVVDLSGRNLADALTGGVFVAKASHEDVVADGLAASADRGALVAAVHRLAERGAQHVVLTRADDAALALIDGRLVEVMVPSFEPVDHRGAGDSFTAGIAAALALGRPVGESLRLGAAAGALNTTRHGLATGRRELIERLAERVEVRPSS